MGSETNPTVCAIMLTKDRPQMAARAVECFRQQTYENKHLIIYDNGLTYPSLDQPKVIHVRAIGAVGSTVGALRNYAIDLALADIIVHWDDDDWSHSNRIAEQVALLQSSGADAVGYREMLFWRETGWKCQTIEVSKSGLMSDPSVYREMYPGPVEYTGEAWLYTNNDPRYIVGSSLCYWRKAWERRPFKDIMRGEDHEFWSGLKSVGGCVSYCRHPTVCHDADCEPRMICSIHGGNTAGYTEKTLTTSINWRRVPEWDEHCRKVMTL